MKEREGDRSVTDILITSVRRSTFAAVGHIFLRLSAQTPSSVGRRSAMRPVPPTLAELTLHWVQDPIQLSPFPVLQASQSKPHTLKSQNK